MILKGDNMRVVISGGGTGGHIYPAVAIIEELKRRDENIEILYIGSKNSMESELMINIYYIFLKELTGSVFRKVYLIFSLNFVMLV